MYNKYSIGLLVFALALGLASVVKGQVLVKQFAAENQNVSEESTAANILQRKTSISVRDQPLKKVLKKIQRKSGVHIFYTRDILKGSSNVTVKAEKQSLNRLLDHILKPNNLDYWTTGNYIILQRKQQDAVLETVTGQITDASSGQPLPGVNILVKGTTTGTSTDSQGKYELNVPSLQDTLVVSFIGYQTKQVSINGRTELNVELQPRAVSGEELVVVGYETQEEASLTGAVDVANVNDIESSSISTGNPMKALDGRMPGVEISYSGDPSAEADVMIRGLGTLNDTSPLYVIDGVPTKQGLNNIPASDIESIQILKDASAATIYGSRAANGVVLVTTKKGNREGAQVEVSSSVTANVLTDNPLPLLDTYEYGRAQWRAARNDGDNPNYGVYSFEDHQDSNGNWVLDEIMLPEWLDAAKTMKPANTDWQDEISRNGFSQNHNLAVSFGSDKGRARLSVDYLDRKGTTKKNKWTRTTISLNSSFNVLDGRLRFGENVSLSRFYETGSNHLPQTANIQSIVPVRTEDGGWGGPVKGMSDRINPVLSIHRNRYNHTDQTRVFGSAFGEIDILDNLNFRTTLSLDANGGWNRNMDLKYQAGFMSNDKTKLDESNNYEVSWTINNVLTYDLTLSNNSDVSVLLGQEAIYQNGADLFAHRAGYALEDPDYLKIGTGSESIRNAGSEWNNALSSYFGKVNYSFDDRFIFNGIVRRDGSSRFGANKRYSIFPSASVAWVLSEESFIQSIPNISFLKIRYGWGMTGNQSIANYPSTGKYEFHYGGHVFLDDGTAYDIEGNDTGQLPAGFRRLNTSNPNLKWETTTQHNWGLDLEMVESKFSLSFDYYLKETEDILIQPPVLDVEGEGAQRWVNGASLKNWGWEAQASYNDQIGEIAYTVSANAYSNTNKVTHLPEEAVGGYPGNGNDKTILGRPFNSFFGYVADGIFQNQSEVDAHATQPGKDVGRLRFKDLNGDGVVNADDRTWIGVNEPDIAFGLNLQLRWNGFDFSTLIRSEIGNDIDARGYGKGQMYFFGFFGGHNYGTPVLDAWSPQNKDSDIPAISASDTNNEQRFSTYFVEDGTFVKLSSVEIGYNIPQTAFNSNFFRGGRIYLQGQNLYSFNNFSDAQHFGKNSYSGYDPDKPNLDYPVPLNVSLGFNLKF